MISKSFGKNNLYRILCILIAVVAMGSMSSCVVTKDSVYFADVPDSTSSYQIALANYQEPRVLVDDVLSIIVTTIDPQVAATINQNQSPEANLASPNSTGIPSGYLVNKSGNIEMPILGTLNVLNLTTTEVASIVRDRAAHFFKNPTVQVRFANYRITVLGEVSKPATYIMGNEKVSLLDAIGMAGDLTIYGKRKNVLLIRDNDGAKQFVRLDLSSADIFRSPYFYLKQNDVVYVEPGKGKVAANNAARTQTFALIASGLTVLLALIARL